MLPATRLKYFHASFKAMGSPCEIQLFAKTQARARQVADAAITDVRRLETR